MTMKAHDKQQKVKNQRLCEKAWKYMCAHPYLPNKAVAEHVGVIPWVFGNWVRKYHAKDLAMLRTKLGLSTRPPAVVDAFHLFRIMAETNTPGRTLVWERYISGVTAEDARKTLDQKLKKAGIKPISVELLSDIPGKISVAVEEFVSQQQHGGNPEQQQVK
jgi:hypothetical protein